MWLNLQIHHVPLLISYLSPLFDLQISSFCIEPAPAVTSIHPTLGSFPPARYSLLLMLNECILLLEE